MTSRSVAISAEAMARLVNYPWPGNEARLIREALSRFQGNRGRAAEALGVSTVSLWRKVKEYGIARDASD